MIAVQARCSIYRTLGSCVAALLFAGALTSSSQAASVAFSWTQNSETNLAGYNLYYGPGSRNYTNNVVLGKVGSYTMLNLVNGATYYFALAAFNSNNVESGLTAELRYPNAPTLSVIANQTTVEDTPLNVPLTVADMDTSISNLTLTATSTNLTLVPVSNITFSDTGTNRTMRIVPAANRSGTSSITVTVSDGALTASQSFLLTVTAVNDAPTISTIADVITDEDVYTAAISFTISDTETAATNLTVWATSSNPTLIPTNHIILGGTGSARTVVLRPVTNENGSATITLTVTDGTLTGSTIFNFTVRPVNDPPSISQIADRNPTEDIPTQVIPFTINDVDTPLSQLVVTATSSNPSLMPQTNILLAGSSSNRTVQLLPATNAFGSAVITIMVSDGQASASMSFTVTFAAVNDPPVVSRPPDLTVNKLNPVPPIPFTVWDVETPASALTITVTSTNITLLPTNRMVVTGTSTNRILTLTPVANQYGTTRVRISVSDGTTNTQVAFQFTCTGSNNPPVLTVPGPFAGNAGAAIVAGGIRVTDLDVGTNNLNLTMTAANGSIVVSAGVANGIKASQISGNNSGSVTIVAPLAALNATLTNANAVVYTSRSAFSGTETLVVTANDNGFSGAGGAMTDTKNIVIQIAGSNSLDRWRASYFSGADLQDPTKEATVWGDLADPDNDGRNNLMEFALGLNPLGSEPQDTVLVSGTVNSGGNQYLTLTFNSRINEPLLQYLVEVSADNATWSATAQRVSTTPVNADFERVTYQDNVAITPQAARFIRLRVVKNGP